MCGGGLQARQRFDSQRREAGLSPATISSQQPAAALLHAHVAGVWRQGGDDFILPHVGWQLRRQPPLWYRRTANPPLYGRGREGM